MLKNIYNNMNKKIKADEKLIEEVLQKAEKSDKKRPSIRIAAIAMAAVLILTVGMPAFAENVSSFYDSPLYDLLYRFAPKTAQFFVPVSESCTDNNIKMEVIATYVHEKTAEIYISMQDLNGDIIDENIDLFDSYDIHRPFDANGHCEKVSYDEDTHTATFLISLTETEGTALKGKKITFSVDKFLTGKRELEDIKIDNAWSAVKDGDIISFTGKYRHNKDYYLKSWPLKSEDAEKIELFQPSETDISSLSEFHHRVTGIGFINNQLHIQIATNQLPRLDAHGYVFLKDKYGNVIEADTGYSFIEQSEAKKRDRWDYNEFVFDITPEELNDYELYGNFWTYSKLTEGKWRVSFKL